MNPAYVGHRQCNRANRLRHRTRWPRHDVTKYFGQYQERAIPVLVLHASIARHVLNACIMYLYLVVCCRSAVPLRPSSGERRTHILLSAVVLTYGSGRRAAHIVYRRFCALSSFRRIAAVVATVFLRNRGVISLVVFWHCLAPLIFAAHLGYVFSQFIMFTRYFLTSR